MKHNKQCIPEHLLNSFRSVMVGQKQNLECFGGPRLFGANQIRGDFNGASMTKLVCIIFCDHQWSMAPSTCLLSSQYLLSPLQSLLSTCPIAKKIPYILLCFPQSCIFQSIFRTKHFCFIPYTTKIWVLVAVWTAQKTKIAYISLNVSKILHKASIHICYYTNELWLKVMLGK